MEVRSSGTVQRRMLYPSARPDLRVRMNLPVPLKQGVSCPLLIYELLKEGTICVGEREVPRKNSALSSPPPLPPSEVRPVLHMNNFICPNHCIMVIKIIFLRSCREGDYVLSYAIEDNRVYNFHRWVERHYDAINRGKEQYGCLWGYHDFGYHPQGIHKIL